MCNCFYLLNGMSYIYLFGFVCEILKASVCKRSFQSTTILQTTGNNCSPLRRKEIYCLEWSNDNACADWCDEIRLSYSVVLVYLKAVYFTSLCNMSYRAFHFEKYIYMFSFLFKSDYYNYSLIQCSD